MSDVVAEVNRGARSGNRLPSLTRWVWNSTDIIVDRYLSGNWKTEEKKQLTVTYC